MNLFWKYINAHNSQIIFWEMDAGGENQNIL
jgi:hypothetical protein